MGLMEGVNHVIVSSHDTRLFFLSIIPAYFEYSFCVVTYFDYFFVQDTDPRHSCLLNLPEDTLISSRATSGSYIA